MAASRQFLAGISRQFPKRFVCRYYSNWFDGKGERLFSLVMSQRLSIISQNHSKSYYSVSSTQSFVNKSIDILPDKKTRSLQTQSQTATDDQEFVSEIIPIPDEKDLESLDVTIKSVKERTSGVLVKMLKKENDQSERSILIGGTRHEVRKAVSVVKSLLNPQSQIQRSLIKLQDEDEGTKHFGNIEKPIWAYYRRNFKGQTPPMKTRKRCIRGKGEKQTVSGNPCPICRLYLSGGYELNYKDIDLLSQFISPHSGEIFEASKTGLCQVQQQNLVQTIEAAKDYGLLPYSIPGPRSFVQPPTVAKIPRNVRLKCKF